MSTTRSIISKMPDVLNREILSFCNARDLANMTAVSHYWADQANNSDLWKKLAEKYKFNGIVPISLQDTEGDRTLLTILIKKQFAIFCSSENIWQLKAAEFKKVHPNLINSAGNFFAESQVPIIYRNAYMLVAFSYSIAVVWKDLLEDIIKVRHGSHNRTIQLTPDPLTFEKMGFFAGRLISLTKRTLKAVPKQTDFVVETVKNVFCCASARSRRS